MDFRQLRYYAQIVESGSLAKASRQLYVAQPALSQQLARLEDEVGQPLLIRSHKGVTPTDNGLALYHHAKFILRQIDQALAIARQESNEVKGMVSIGLPSTTMSALGQPLVTAIRARYPGILLNVVEGMSGHLSQMLRSGQLDMAILFNAAAAPDLSRTPIIEEELFVMISASSQLVASRRKKITIAEAARLPLILPTSSHGLRQRIANEFETRNLTPHIIAEIDSLSLLMNCVADGMGATIKPMAALLHKGSKRKNWRAIGLSDVKLNRRNYLYTADETLLSPAASLIATELKRLVHTLVDTGKWPSVTLL
ncbi:LysR family transcriptional regulator [Pusillimonas sp. MFBS29]|uniref:LysR substrate-binding domain-containing protein n=1 Tax=Pusillimonas sp. MFBS29 TaxID=2886690 RepID=UPI001D12FD89|nr:LysR substrate-binding domain-containing protein [Pusillimonas sp. MFBS29]MCC2596849.1 LysR family transcriptional regulator [Pusillimonas sp. MFBS29]